VLDHQIQAAHATGATVEIKARLARPHQLVVLLYRQCHDPYPFVGTNREGRSCGQTCGPAHVFCGQYRMSAHDGKEGERGIRKIILGLADVDGCWRSL
jgi:hypothetical protein